MPRGPAVAGRFLLWGYETLPMRIVLDNPDAELTMTGHSLFGWFRRMLMAGAVAGAGVLALGGAAAPAAAQTPYNAYCYAPYYNPYYCQYYSGYYAGYPYNYPYYAGYPYYGWGSPVSVGFGFGFGGFHHPGFFHGGFPGGFHGGFHGGGFHGRGGFHR